jgi:hypothetical protein
MTRSLACITYLFATIGFVIGGIGIFVGQSWSQPVIVGAAVFSTVIIFLLWNGKRKMVVEQGGIGLFLNVLILVALLLLDWPSFEF